MSRLLPTFLAVSLVVTVALARGQAADSSSNSTAAPTLAALSRETQALYEEVRPGVVRVHLPPTYWPEQLGAANENPMEKWRPRLDPALRDKLDQAVGSQISPATQPVAGATTQPANVNAYFVVPLPRLAVSQRPDGGFELLPF